MTARSRSTGTDLAAVRAATKLLSAADLGFVLVAVQGEVGEGAIFSNISPSEAILAIEGALKAARRLEGRGETLQ